MATQWVFSYPRKWEGFLANFAALRRKRSFAIRDLFGFSLMQINSLRIAITLIFVS